MMAETTTTGVGDMQLKVKKARGAFGTFTAQLRAEYQFMHDEWCAISIRRSCTRLEVSPQLAKHVVHATAGTHKQTNMHTPSREDTVGSKSKKNGSRILTKRYGMSKTGHVVAQQQVRLCASTSAY